MPPVIVHVDVSDINDIFEGMAQRVEAYPMALISEGLATAVDDLIQAEGDGQWAPLSPNTLRRRPRRKGGMLLQDYGLLADIQTREGGDWAEAWSPAPYAGFHITGTEWMPERDWTDIPMASVLEQFTEDILDDAVGGMN